ncbi:DUF89 domain-containing protein [Nitrospirota bacterium]
MQEDRSSGTFESVMIIYMNLLDGLNMNLALECYPCFLRQTMIALRVGGIEGEKVHEVMRAVLEDVAAADFSRSPSHASTPLHRRVREMLGLDPFEGVKRKYNSMAMAMLPMLRGIVSASDEPLETAVRLAIAGNVIDFGIYDEVDIEGAIRKALQEPLEVDNYKAFLEAVEETSDVLYLLDNSGEIVFDMLLIEQLKKMGKEVTAVVRGAPIINDCTMVDAKEVGLDEVCRVIDNGNDSIGTDRSLAGDEFRRLWERPGQLVVSKGQGNFETLLGERNNIFFLLQAKCDVVARLLGIGKGAMLLIQGLR